MFPLGTQTRSVLSPATAYAGAIAQSAEDELADYDLRDTLRDIVVRPLTFVRFRAALEARRGRLH
ncbi:MAG: hypothetical protein HZT41_17350 [Dechloromonas sp.]|jgi:hypothetical protein|nr:hypothetical protein [Xanthomonadales bacterium]QLQ26369.1 MAG: hypothetical protein HZT41_17350 [Dechloromonas sp.]